MNLALFDFDGTITDKDTFTAFICFAASPKRIFWGKILLFHIIFLYRTGFLASPRVRQAIAGFAFKGCRISKLYSFGQQFSETIIPKHLRPEAVKKIKWHKANGDRVVVVTASLDIYMKFWCKNNGLDLICTKYKTSNGRATGEYRPMDCSGKEKARRIKQKYPLDKFAAIYAYGDTPEDLAMLRLADVKYYRWKKI